MSEHIGLSLMGLRFDFPYAGFGVASLIRNVKKLGFEEIEFPIITDELQMATIAQTVKVTGVHVCAIHAEKNLMQTSPKSLNDKVEATVRFAAALDSNLIVLHPAPEWPSHDQIETLARGFAKYKLAIENTNSVAVEWVKILSEYIECGIALDISHARYLGQPIDYYFTANVFHTHIRGYNSCERYTRIGPSDHEAIIELLYKEKQGLYKGALMLEYPYISLDDACDDKDVLTQLRKLVFE